MPLGFQSFPWYSLIVSFTDLCHLNTIMMGVGKVRKFCTHVKIIEVDLMKCIAKF